MTRRDNNFLLPEVIDPQRIRFCIEIPDDLNHIIAFWGALSELEKAWNWQWDGAKTGLAAAIVWQDVLRNAHQSYLEGDCLSEQLCQDYRNTSPRLTWHPENPFNPDPEVPDGYTFHPWTVVTTSIIDSIISVFGLGYKVGDVFTDISKFPFFAGWDNILTNYAGLPYIKMTGLTGVGNVKLHFLNIYQGGRILLFKDGYVSLNPLEWQAVELNRDEISFPPETEVEIIIDVDFDTDGEHFLDIVFSPIVDDALIPLFFGAGLRSFELCGFGREGCGDMDDPCCPDSVEQATKTNVLLEDLIALLKGGATVNFNLSGAAAPDTTAGNCAPAFFDHNTDETDSDVLLQRQKALCITCERYVKSVLIGALVDMGAPTALTDWVASLFPQTIPAPLLKLTIVYPSVLSGLAAFFEALTGGVDLTLIACQMIDSLTGDKNNTFGNFKTSVQADLLTTLLVPLAGLIQSSNGVKQNYLAFNDALELANDEDLSAYSCPCVDLTEITLVDDLTGTLNDTTFTRIDETHWHITQPTIHTGDKYGLFIRDSLNRQLNFLSIDQAVFHWYLYAAGDPTGMSPTSDGAGAYSGNFYTIGMDFNSPVDCIVEIALV